MNWPYLILQTFIFVVKTILTSGPICREIEKQAAKKEVEKWLAQGKLSEARKLAPKYTVFQKWLFSHRTFHLILLIFSVIIALALTGSA